MHGAPEGQGAGGPRGIANRLALPRRANAEGASGTERPLGQDFHLAPAARRAPSVLRSRAWTGSGGGVGGVHELGGEEAGMALEEGGEVLEVSRKIYLKGGRRAPMCQIPARESKHWRGAL
jgi:hypothetical protein